MNSIHVVGIGDDGELGPRARRLVLEAELLFGGERHLGFFPDARAEKTVVRSNLKEIAEKIAASRERRIVVLASGDPLFYGIGKFLIGKFGREAVEVIPSVSSMQLAFARVKESWEDATLVSVHARSIDEIVETVRGSKKVGMFTDDENTPSRIASTLLQNGVTGLRAYVCENLGGADEKVTQTDLTDLPGMSFGPLNVLILVKKPYEPPAARRDWTIGIPEEEFFQRQPDKGLITKTEVRVISLSKMKLSEKSVVWDIGAGSGSVSIEAALIARQGTVHAVEKNAEDAALVEKNAQKFGTRNVHVLHGTAPETLPTDAPDAVFIGGSGGSMSELARACLERLKPGGRLVVNAATVENLAEAMGALPGAQALLVQVARSRPILDLTRFEALNPVYVVWAVKL